MSRSLLAEDATGVLAEDSTGLFLEQDTYLAEVLADSPISLWRLGETSGTIAVDYMGVVNGTYTGGYTQNQTGALAADTDKAVLLNGSTGYVIVPDHASLDLGDGPMSIECWIKRSNTTATEMKFGTRGNLSWELRITTGHFFYFGQYGVGTIVETTTTVNDTNWHHMVATKNGAAAKIYIDGNDVSGTTNSRTLSNVTDSLNIGRRFDNAEYFAGLIDEFAVYGTVLSASRVKAHYNAGVTP